MGEIRCKSMDMAERKALVARLAAQFAKNEAFYTNRDFVESEARSKFIDLLLEALKWDVKNEKGARHAVLLIRSEKTLKMYFLSPLPSLTPTFRQCF